MLASCTIAFNYQLPITNRQLPVTHQNKVREDIIKSLIKTIICKGLHSTLQAGGRAS
ncbi:MAG: hypothetical protein AAF630_18965 [Cyanobacteria bacterium P01_C01_bin.38]